MKVLIVSLDNLGDTITAFALCDAVRSAAGFEVSLWTKTYAGEIVSIFDRDMGHFHCDPFWDRSPGTPKGSFTAFSSVLNRIRESRFDAALILKSNWRKNLSCMLAGIPRRYVLKGPFGTDTVHVPDNEPHVLDAYRRLARAVLGKDPGPLRYGIPSPVPPAPEETENLLSSGDWAVIHPFSGDLRKNFPVSSWPAVIGHLSARGLRVYINAGIREKETLSAAIRETGAEAAPVFSCDYAHTIPALARAVSKARIFIGNDSGPLHLASALGTPCAGIFPLKNVKKISPMGKYLPRLLTFRDSASEISPEKVNMEIDRILDGSPTIRD